MKRLILLSTFLALLSGILHAKVPSCPLTASITATGSIICHGGTVTLTVAAAGGVTPYTGEGSYIVGAGTYYYTVTDATGCSATASYTVAQPDELVATATAGQILCNGGTTTINVTASGGTAPYSGTGVYTVSAGSYTYTVTDANGCLATTTVTVTEPEPLVVAECGCHAAACHGATIYKTIDAWGGTGPYTGTGTFTVPAGTYTFSVTDANGCSGSVNVVVTEPEPLVTTAVAGIIACNGGGTTVNVTATGGTEPYTGTGSFPAYPGTYNYTVWDVKGCSSTATVTITEPAALTLSASASTDCNGNSTTTVTATGGTAPYTGVGTFTVTPGTYTYTVTDANGCTASSTVTAEAVTPLAITAPPGSINCNGGTTTITVSATGGLTPYSGTGTYTVAAGPYNYTVTDAHGCTATASGNISEPAPLTVSVSAGSISTPGGTTTASVTATGGTEPYTGTGSFTVSAGTYTYTVTDANGCTGAATISITDVPPLTVTATPGTINCYGGATTVTVTASGGQTPYTGTGTYTVTAGSYSYTVTDHAGQTATTTVNITQPAALAASIAGGTIACHGGTTALAVTATGGTAPYSGTGTYTVPAGSYSYTVTDANGCTTTTSATLTEPSEVTATAIAGFISVYGGSTTVIVNGAGGTAPYTGTGIYTVTAGTYTYTVTDANGCSGTTTITVNEPTPLNVVATLATPGSITCYGGVTTVSVTATGGTMPYSGTGIYTVTAGTYNYTVTDASGQSSTTTITVTQPAQVTASATAAMIPCNGGSTAVTVTAAGGVAPYTGTGTFTATAGTHNYTVTDANGCTATATVGITEPAAITATAAAGNILCAGGTTAVNVTATGGIAPYTGTGTYTVVAGVHTYTVTDAAGCAATTTVTVTQPGVIIATANAAPIKCYGQNTEVIVAATGGTAPYTAVGTYTVTAGTYTFTVTDANGCAATTALTLLQPDKLNVYATSTGAGCGDNASNGKAWIAATGGTAPYTTTWSAAAGGHTADSATGLKAGKYTAVIVDANGCSASITVTITGGNSPIVISPIVKNLNCYNDNSGSIELQTTGGVAPYRFNWSTGDNMSRLANLAAGTYSVSVKDEAGCTATSTIDVTQPDSMYVVVETSLFPGGYHVSAHQAKDGSVKCTLNGGTAPYRYTWSNGATTQDLTDVAAGKYALQVTDNNGCTVAARAELTEPLPIDVPTAFSPNGDGHNDYFVINGIDNFPDNILTIYNRWGNEVYETRQYQNTWDGHNKQNEMLPDGTYFVVLKINNGEISRAGYVEIRRN